MSDLVGRRGRGGERGVEEECIPLARSVSHVPGLRALGSFLVTSSLSFTALVDLEELFVKNMEDFDLPFVVGVGVGFGAAVAVVVSD